MRRRTGVPNRHSKRATVVADAALLERKLNKILYWQLLILKALGVQQEMEAISMAKFDSLLAQVSRLRTRVDSTNAFVKGLQAKTEELAAGMSDEEDQKQVEQFAAEIGALTDTLPQAIEQGTGGSEGGVGGGGSEGGVGGTGPLT